MIYLVRHTHAGSRKAWKADDSIRPLSEQGWLQAKIIAERLATATPRRLVASPFTRCIQSLEPLAELLGTSVEGDRALAEGSAPEEALALIRSLPDGSVVCTHGDVVTNLIGHLAAHGVDVDPGVNSAKASVWHLERRDGRVVSGTYAPPPSL